jgi:hypothetical protein
MTADQSCPPQKVLTVSLHPTPCASCGWRDRQTLILPLSLQGTCLLETVPSPTWATELQLWGQRGQSLNTSATSARPWTSPCIAHASVLSPVEGGRWKDDTTPYHVQHTVGPYPVPLASYLPHALNSEHLRCAKKQARASHTTKPSQLCSG